MVSPLFCVFCVFAQGFSLKMQLVLQKNQKKPQIIMVWHFTMLQTLVFHPFGKEHAIKPMVLHILNPMKIPGGPMGSWMLESNQRIEAKNRINESNQWIESMNRINEPNEWTESVNRISESNQWTESMNRINEPNQWIESMNRIRESKQGIESIHRIRDSNQWIESMNLNTRTLTRLNLNTSRLNLNTRTLTLEPSH